MAAISRHLMGTGVRPEAQHKRFITEEAFWPGATHCPASTSITNQATTGRWPWIARWSLNGKRFAVNTIGSGLGDGG